MDFKELYEKYNWGQVTKEEQEFVERKQDQHPPQTPVNGDGFMNIPDGLDEELPFN